MSYAHDQPASVISWRHRLVARYYRSREHPGRLRLLRWLKYSLKVERIRTMVAPGVVMELDDTDYVNRQILLHGGYERATLRLFDRLLAEARGILDIGAHHGQYTLRAARALSTRGGTVAAFEPMPQNSARLLRNAELSGLHNIELYTVALSDRSGLASVVAHPAWNSGGTRIGGHSNTPASHECGVHVAMCTWSDIGRRLPPDAFDLVKLDIEGHEGRVLGTLFKSALPRPRHLLVEYTPKEFDYGVSPSLPAWLASQGYNIRTVTGAAYSQSDPLPEDNLWAELQR